MGWDSWAFIFLLFFLITPVAQFGVCWARKRRARRALQLERGARVIPIIFNLQTVAAFGLPLARFEQLPLPCEVERVVRATPQSRPIDLVVDLPAGVAFDVAAVVAAVAAHEAPVTLIVPRRALVGGIALAGAADTILLGPGAVLCGDEAAPVNGSAARGVDRAAPVDGAAGRSEDQAAPVGLSADGRVTAGPAAAVVEAPHRASAAPADVCDLAGLLALGLPAREGLPAVLPAYLAHFKEPRPTRHQWPLYMALPRAGRPA